MVTVTIHTRLRREEIRRFAAMLPALLAGRLDDQNGIAHGFAMRLAFAFLEKVKLAFIVKSRGGIDEAGISWPKLTKAYLAYGRRFGRGEQAAIKKAAGLGKANRFAPGGDKGLLTAAQLKRWRQVYAQNLAWLSAREGEGEAKGHAAAIAWATLKREGAKTKLDVYGNREVEILRDTGVLFNSLSPGELVTSGPDAHLPGKENQIITINPGELIVGTSVAYAAANHKRRPLWPEPGQIPGSWLRQFTETAAKGVAVAIEQFGRRAA